MQPETEEADVKVDGSVQKEVVQEESLNKERTTNEDPTDAPVEVSASDSKENVDNPEEKVTNVDENGIRNETESYNHSNQEKQDEEENELILTIDESPSKLTPDTKEEAIEEMKNAISNEDVPSESQTDTESYSVDIVESTTSEISETTESSSQNEVLKEKQIKSNDDVTYNSNIALKDVQIKLNDCLRDNLKQTNASGSERNTPEPLSKDMSFGKTLRNISGRSGLGRMRHNGPVERRFSPNNSLFVNTSSMSLPTEDGLDYKILHHRSGLSDSFSTNGSSTDKKRKLDLEESHSSKKQKIESESSFFNTSISLLKGLRKPIQVSTPNIGSYKFQSEKLNLSGLSNDGKQVTTETDGKKWCVIM